MASNGEAFVLFKQVCRRLRNPDFLVYGYRCSRADVAILFPNKDARPMRIPVEAVEKWKATGQFVTEE